MDSQGNTTFNKSTKKDKNVADSPRNNDHSENSSNCKLLQTYSDDCQFRQGLNNLRLLNIYTDIKLIAQGKEFHAHKFILATGSDYFYQLFSEKNPTNVIEIKGIESNVLDEMLSFLYTGQINFDYVFSCENLNSLLQLGEKLGIGSMEKDILLHLVKNPTKENYDQALRLACKLKDLASEKKIIEYLSNNLEATWTSSEFVNLPQKHLMDIFSNVRHQLTSHDILLRVLLTWTTYRFEERRGMLVKFLQFINFDNVSTSLAGFLLQNDFVRLSNETKTLRTELSNRVGARQAVEITPQTSPRSQNSPKSSQVKENQDVLVVVGRDHANRAVLTKFNFVKNTWTKVEDTGASLDINPGIGYYQNKIFFVGGQDFKGNKLTTVQYYDLETHSLHFLKNLSVARAGPGVVGSKKSLVVVGGLGRFSRQGLSITEILDLTKSSSKWVPGHQLRMRRGDDTRLMLINGTTVVTGGGTPRCEYFNTKSNCWMLSEPLPDDVQFETALYAVADETLYAFKYYKPNFVYMLDVSSGQWSSKTVKGKSPEWVLCAVGWKTIIFVIDKSKLLFILDTIDCRWSESCKIPRKMVYPVFVDCYHK